MKEESVTFLELVIVIIIIGILATLGISQYYPARESALDREATANLKLIQAAERVYQMELSFYYPFSGTETDIGIINTDLRLLLPGGASRSWDYQVKDTGCVEATRTLAPTRNWRFAIGEDEPVSGTCP